MEHEFTIDGDEAFALATECAAVTGGTVDQAGLAGLRLLSERAHQAGVQRMVHAFGEFQALLGAGTPIPDHSWVHDDATGFPV